MALQHLGLKCIKRENQLIRVTLAVSFCALLSGCMTWGEAKDGMAGYPMHDVKIGLPAPFACDWNQRMGMHYTGIDNETGKPVSGVICTNLFEDSWMAQPNRE